MCEGEGLAVMGGVRESLKLVAMTKLEVCHVANHVVEASGDHELLFLSTAKFHHRL